MGTVPALLCTFEKDFFLAVNPTVVSFLGFSCSNGGICSSGCFIDRIKDVFRIFIHVHDGRRRIIILQSLVKEQFGTVYGFRRKFCLSFIARTSRKQQRNSERTSRDCGIQIFFHVDIPLIY